MSWCIGCDSWTPVDLCDACSFHTGLVWARDDESYPEEQGMAENRSEDGQTANGGDNE
jgi:hypothetical protein